ncbi:cell division protein SepF [Peptoniphilaceae bacterium SGI.137]|nr:cell division protein SepF [Peptoniphilaceae bacterium]MDY4195803.1 cell division protein SepF [Peptoniphilaceae bacterium]MDY5842533.1 cell division protein SepF [Peptoniphilaceae bacterium]MDY6146706.1 cell division protein SepF [Peptoniphilaceae bacterium]
MGLWDKVKNMVGIEDEYYDEDYPEDYEATSSEPAGEAPASSFANTSYSSTNTEEAAHGSRLSNIVSMSTGSRMRISIQEPLEYEDGTKVIDNTAQQRTVILNLEMMEVDKKRQIFDFVSGGVYALGGKIQKVTKDIYVIVPKGIEIDSTLKDSVSGQNLYQL